MTIRIDTNVRIADFWAGKGKFSAEIARKALDEARALPAVEVARVAAVVLLLPDGRPRLDLAWLDDERDHEHGAFGVAESSARENARALAPGETLKVELREVLLASTRIVRLGEVHDRIADWTVSYALRGQDHHLDDARETIQTLLFCQNVLVLPDGERCIVSEQLEVGDGEALRHTEDLHRELRRERRHLRPGERLEVAFREGSLDETELVREAVVAGAAARRGALHFRNTGAA